MKHAALILSSLLLAAITTVAMVESSGHAAKSAAAFNTPTTFEHVTKSMAFACGKRDASGREFGTAHEIVHRTVWTFRPDGTVSIDRGFPSAGRGKSTYSIAGRVLTVVHTDAKGRHVSTQKLKLSKDGSKLGTMRLIPRSP